MHIFLSSLALLISSLMGSFGFVSVAPVAHTSTVVVATQTNILTSTIRTIPIRNIAPTISQTTVHVTEIQPASNFTLTVASSTYTTYIHEGDTLYDTMRTLASTTDFTFTGREYIGVGFFVESINDKKNEGGLYWILYVNGVLASHGISQTTLHVGDRVEWRYEKSY